MLKSYTEYKLLSEQLASLEEQYGLVDILRYIDLTGASPMVTNYITDAIEALELDA